MKTKPMVLTLAYVAVLGGCVIMPTAPTVVALPGSQKGYDQFRADEDACRSYSQAAVSGSTQAASNYAAGTAVAGTAIGAAAGAIIGSASGQAGPGAAIGAGTGLLFGSLAGADAAGYSSYDLQRRYDVTYVQCMYERGNRVPARFVYRGPSPGYGPGYRAPEQVPPDYVPNPAPQGRLPDRPSA
jgi:hypothetical protein